ncbi:unnamed protein product [Withania somnifera]
MGRSWLIDGRGLASKVKNVGAPAAHQIKDCGAKRQCPNCHYCIDNNDVSHEWPGLPVGVKFDPSDEELVEHLEAKCGMGNSEPHKFIDEFIPTLEVNEGICYTHPENLPGAKKDGSCIHFFYRISNAYATGTRKRRKIHDENNLMKEHFRWHKTGKTKVVMENGLQKGCKKVMVLYQTTKKGSKQEKTNWVMHQYHLGLDEDEKEGEHVVSKIFYQQQKQSVKANDSCDNEEASVGANQTGPTTPKTVTPDPPRAGETPSCDDIVDDSLPSSPDQEVEVVKEPGQPSDTKIKCEMVYPTCLAGESQAADANDVDISLLCDERNDSYVFLDSFGPNIGSVDYTHNTCHLPQGNGNTSCGISELDNLELDTPPDFQLAVSFILAGANEFLCIITSLVESDVVFYQDLPFGSQENIFSWLDRL